MRWLVSNRIRYVIWTGDYQEPLGSNFPQGVAPMFERIDQGISSKYFWQETGIEGQRRVGFWQRQEQ